MFEPIWLGNYIVPRWEAIALVLGVPAACVVIAVIVGGLIYGGIVNLVKRINE